MNKVSNLFIIVVIVKCGCAETVALLAPLPTAAGGGNVAQSVVSSAASYGIKKKTGKTPSEHALNYIEKNNPDKKKKMYKIFRSNQFRNMRSS